jgi:hypothetical protein
MKRFANNMVTVSCLLVGAALLCGNQLQGLPHNLFAQSKPLGRMTDKDLAAVWGGNNDQRCWESSDDCAEMPAASCNNANRYLGANEDPCSQSNVINGNTGKYYSCAMVTGDPNEQHCGVPSTVHCETKTVCMSNKIQGSMQYIVQPDFSILPVCISDSSTTYCGRCSSGTSTGQGDHDSIRCVKD